MTPNENPSSPSSPPAAPALAPRRWLTEHLMDAYRSEQRLLEDLARLLLQQRAALASEDHEALDDATFGIQRVMQSLTEAGRRPRLITSQFRGAGDDSPVDLVEALGLPATSELLAARDELRVTDCWRMSCASTDRSWKGRSRTRPDAAGRRQLELSRRPGRHSRSRE
jgi:hypothetical protein